MNIYYDENMPFASQFFGALGQLVPFSGRNLTPEQIQNAEVLLVRSITKVDQQLLHLNDKLQFVGTATIGVDHVDQAYLSERNIPFYSAPGCNAIAVAEYVISALAVMAERYLIDLSTITVGIVGAGNTGTRLSEKLAALGIRYLLCDPILAQQGDQREFSTLAEVLQCEVISLHVPLTHDGEQATYHLLNENNLAVLSNRQILINVCRGEVVDNQALLTLKQRGHGVKLIWDVWENEPDLLTTLIPYTDIATAHIAGYSLEGKARGTEMLYQALCQQLQQPSPLSLAQFLPLAVINQLTMSAEVELDAINTTVKMVYDLRRDDAIFRQQLATQGFDWIRKNYPTRREFSAVKISLLPPANNDVLHRLGFSK